jgi:NADH:ubiquinone oxidoreductase subunit H
MFFVVELLELGVFVFSVTSRNHFVALALSRLAIVGTFSALTLELIIFWTLLSGYWLTEGSLSSQLCGGFLVILPVFSVLIVMFVTGKVPFDLVEAESELIDGVSSDISGGVFSLFYAAEVMEFLFLIKFMVVGLLGVSLMVFAVLLMITFMGRIFVARFLFVEAITVFLSIGLSVGPLWLVNYSFLSDLGTIWWF